jgi:hypothetical protein
MGEPIRGTRQRLKTIIVLHDAVMHAISSMGNTLGIAAVQGAPCLHGHLINSFPVQPKHILPGPVARFGASPGT